MPILEITLLQESLTLNTMQIDPARRFSKLANIDQSLVTVAINKVNNCFGNKYLVIAHLYIPDLWSSEKTEEMQTATTRLILDCWHISPNNSIVLVHLIQPGHVMDRGIIERW